MYVSPAVRSLRRHPAEGETVTLLLTVAEDAAVAAVERALEGVPGATGTERLAFDTVRTTVPQASVEAVCELEGIAAVETDDTLALSLDGAGEDVEPD